MKKSILISAGEASGDIHAANLIRNLKKLKADLCFFGIGGERMQKEGVELVERMDRFSTLYVKLQRGKKNRRKTTSIKDEGL